MWNTPGSMNVGSTLSAYFKMIEPNVKGFWALFKCVGSSVVASLVFALEVSMCRIALEINPQSVLGFPENLQAVWIGGSHGM